MTGKQNAPVIVVFSTPEDSPWPGLETLENQARVIHTTNAEELRAALPGASILVVTDFNAKVLKEAWPAAESVEWIHATSAGVDTVLIPEIVDSDVVVTNARGFFDTAVAEYVIGLVLTFAKDLLGTRDLQFAHQWRHRDTARVACSRMLVVGAGSIGREIARLANALGIEVEGIGRSAREDPYFTTVYRVDLLLERLPQADFVVIAAPLTESTRGLFGTEAFAAMSGSAHLINIGRGEIVQTEALVHALRNGELAGAALDVFEHEPLPADHVLWDFPQVIISPHMAGDVFGWREALSQQFIDNFHRRQRGEKLLNIVDKAKGYGSVKT